MQPDSLCYNDYDMRHRAVHMISVALRTYGLYNLLVTVTSTTLVLGSTFLASVDIIVYYIV